MVDINVDLLQWLINVLINKTSGGAIKNEIMSKKLAKELHKPINRKFENQKVQYDLGADLADMQLLSKCNKGIRFLLCFIYISSKYACVIPLKDKKGTTISIAFQKTLDESNRKPNKIWVDKGSEFYNISMNLF